MFMKCFVSETKYNTFSVVKIILMDTADFCVNNDQIIGFFFYYHKGTVALNIHKFSLKWGKWFPKLYCNKSFCG